MQIVFSWIIAYLLALINQNDKYHEQAKAILPSTRVADEVCTTEAILIEIGNSSYTISH